MGWPFTVVYSLLIIGAIYFTWVVVPENLNRHNWPKVMGEITSSEVIQRQRRNKTGDVIKVFSAKVNYQYSVDGKDYQQQAIILADHHTDKHIKKAIHSDYAVGAKRNVYYNPNQPNVGTLEPYMTDDHIAIAIFLFTSIGIMAFAMYRTARKRKQP